ADGCEPFVGIELRRGAGHVVQGPTSPPEVHIVFAALTVAQENESRTSKREHHGALVDGRASPVLLRCHEARRAILAVAIEPVGTRPDRKSTRLNSSHVAISYAVFCLKKKNRN